MWFPPDTVIFFDAGGTLIRPAVPVGEVYARVASNYAVTADPAALQQGFLAAWSSLKPRDPIEGARVMDDKLWWHQVVRQSWSGLPLPDTFPFDHYFEEVYAAFAMPRLWRVFPDALLALEKLHSARVRCAVLSNWDRRLTGILDGLDLAHHFEAVLVSSELGVEKPHPRIFELAQEKLGVQADHAILIGDEDRFDAAGARAAGWRHITIDRPRLDVLDALEKLSTVHSS